MDMDRIRVEEEYVKSIIWGEQIDYVAQKYHQMKVLEFMDPSQKAFWMQLKERYPEKEIILHGISRSKRAEKGIYHHLFTEKQGRVMKKKQLKKQLPYTIARFVFRGGGDEYDIENRYDKFPFLSKFIKWQSKRIDAFTLQVIFELSDALYPFSKIEPDILSQHEDAKAFIESRRIPDLRTVWMSIFGVALQIDREARKRGYGVRLIGEPVTFMNESSGEKVRKMAYSFHFEKGAHMPVSDVVQDLKNIKWIRFANGAPQDVSQFFSI